MLLCLSFFVMSFSFGDICKRRCLHSYLDCRTGKISEQRCRAIAWLTVVGIEMALSLC